MRTKSRPVRVMIATLVAVAAVATTSAATEPNVADVTDQSDDPRLVSLATLPELQGATSAVAAGDYAYVSFTGGLATVSLQDPGAPSITDVEPTLNAIIGDESIEVGDGVLMVIEERRESTSLSTTACTDKCVISLFDLADPTDPELAGTIETRAHNAACIDGCRYVYTTAGEIIDATIPARPTSIGRIEHDDFMTMHSLTEVRPGRVLGVTTSMRLLYFDTTNPAAPVLLTNDDTELGRFWAGNDVVWPDDSDLVFITESGMIGGQVGDCAADDATGIRLVDASEVRNLEAGLDGSMVFSDLSTVPWGAETNNPQLWLECATTIAPHPSFAGDGLVAVGNSQAGVALAHISEDGAWTTLYRNASDGTEPRATVHTIWHSEDILLTADARHGLEVLVLLR